MSKFWINQNTNISLFSKLSVTVTEYSGALHYYSYCKLCQRGVINLALKTIGYIADIFTVVVLIMESKFFGPCVHIKNMKMAV